MLKRKGMIFSLSISALFFAIMTIMNIVFGFSWGKEFSSIFWAISIYGISSAAYNYGVMVSTDYNFEEVWESGYEMGKEHGKIEGRMDGYSEGHEKGLNDGYDIGVNGSPEAGKCEDDDPNVIYVEAEVE